MNFQKVFQKVLQKVKSNWKQKLLFLIGITVFFFGLWQIDLIASGPVWCNGWVNNDYVNQPFEFGRLGPTKLTTTMGAAYCLCQGMLVIGLMMTVLATWLWE